MERIPYGEARFYQGKLIQCKSYHDDYACSCGGVTLSDGDGMDPHTQVPIVRCAWVHVTMSYRAWHLMSLLPEDLTPAALLGTERALGSSLKFNVT
jgi:hypothetical protein